VRASWARSGCSAAAKPSRCCRCQRCDADESVCAVHAVHDVCVCEKTHLPPLPHTRS
jgi:hypothetical protein